MQSESALVEYSVRNDSAAMIHSDRVRRRMQLIGVSGSELARRIGVTQGAVAKVANNNPNASSFLHKLARELRTTPAYLTAETDDPDAVEPAASDLGSEERDLLDCFGMLGPADRAAVMRHAQALSGKLPPPPGRLHAPRRDYRGQGE